MHEVRTVAVVGAGLAGMAAARRLQDGGLRAIVFEKSRGVGGRMATRRQGDAQFDHGAQFFTARGPAFGSRVDGWARSGIVASWPEKGFSGRTDGCWVGVPTMNAPVRALADGLLIVTERRITDIVPAGAEGGWRLRDADGIVSTAGIDRFDAVALAVPAPQAIPLLAGSGAVLEGLDRAVLAPCWSLMLTVGRGVRDMPQAFSPEDGAIAWIARNATKPGRSGPDTLVVHATPDWSRVHLEQTPEAVMPLMLDRLRQCIRQMPEILHSEAHRWRYAMVEHALGVPCVWNAEAALGACGDWCLGPRVEAAFDSGLALAARILGEPAPPLARDRKA